MTTALTLEERTLLCAPYSAVLNVTYYEYFVVKRYISLALFITGVIYLVISSARFLYYHNIVFTLGIFVQLIGGVLEEAFQLPCALSILALCLVLPMIIPPITVKLLDYYIRFVLAQAVLDRGNLEDLSELSGETDLVVKPDLEAATVSMIPNAAGSTPESRAKEIRKLKLLTSAKVRILFVLCMILPFAIAVAVEFPTVPFLGAEAGCTGCNLTRAQTLMIIVGGCALIVLGVMFAIVVRKHPDPFGVVQECRLLLQYAGTIGIVGFILGRFLPKMQFFSMGWVVHFAALLGQFITTDLQIYITMKEARASGSISYSTEVHRSSVASQEPARRRSKDDLAISDKRGSGTAAAPVDLMAATPETLRAVLKDQKERALFESHLVSEFASESIVMYVDCEKFRKTYYESSTATRRSRARKIVDIHVSDEALIQVNLPGVMRTELVKNVRDPDFVVEVDFFKEAERELFHMLLGSYQRYVKSGIFKASHPGVTTLKSDIN